MASHAIASLVLAALGLCACKERASLTLRDSEGRTFSARCPEELSSCVLTQESGARAGGAAPSLRAKGRYIGVCDSTHDADCRLLTCSSDAECPAPGRAPSGSCIGGACVDPRSEINASDAVMLCLAGSGLGHAEPRQIERYALALNCGTPCRVPTPCERR
jgi:hypothetical protein